jgi:hypothetical protein
LLSSELLKKGGSRPDLLEQTTIGFADRAVEGGIPKESAKPYFLPQISRREEVLKMPKTKPRTSKQYGGSELRQPFFERSRATADEEKIGRNPAVKIIRARDEILTEIRNKEIEAISQKVEKLRVEIQNTNLALEDYRERSDFFLAKIKLLKMERSELRRKINEMATERARLIIRRNELERTGPLVYSGKH